MAIEPRGHRCTTAKAELDPANPVGVVFGTDSSEDDVSTLPSICGPTMDDLHRRTC